MQVSGVESTSVILEVLREEERTCAVREAHGVKVRDQTLCGGHDSLMGEHDTLGVSSGPGGVHDGAQVLGCRGVCGQHGCSSQSLELLKWSHLQPCKNNKNLAHRM